MFRVHIPRTIKIKVMRVFQSFLSKRVISTVTLWLVALLSLVSLSQADGNPQPTTNSPSQTAYETALSKSPLQDSSHLSKGAKDSLTLVKQIPKSRSDSVQVVKHGFNHREQIITGSVVMTCLALIMVTMNNYNPR